ncbi:MAG: hypothetical protein QF752_16605 [Planctomycetota bacterium]|nr:hypothetical protein [Planctomycetota bacterium]
MSVLKGLLVGFGICLVAYLFTNFWIRWAYRQCPECRALNLPKRTKCRLCQHPFLSES